MFLVVKLALLDIFLLQHSIIFDGRFCLHIPGWYQLNIAIKSINTLLFVLVSFLLNLLFLNLLFCWHFVELVNIYLVWWLSCIHIINWSLPKTINSYARDNGFCTVGKIKLHKTREIGNYLKFLAAIVNNSIKFESVYISTQANF